MVEISSSEFVHYMELRGQETRVLRQFIESQLRSIFESSLPGCLFYWTENDGPIFSPKSLLQIDLLGADYGEKIRAFVERARNGNSDARPAICCRFFRENGTPRVTHLEIGAV
jgi:hypothetical protein